MAIITNESMYVGVILDEYRYSCVKKIKEKQGEVLHFKFNGSRNQVEEFKGEIIKTYPAIFLDSIRG